MPGKHSAVKSFNCVMGYDVLYVILNGCGQFSFRRANRQVNKSARSSSSAFYAALHSPEGVFFFYFYDYDIPVSFFFQFTNSQRTPDDFSVRKCGTQRNWKFPSVFSALRSVCVGDVVLYRQEGAGISLLKERRATNFNSWRQNCRGQVKRRLWMI